MFTNSEGYPARPTLHSGLYATNTMIRYVKCLLLSQALRFMGVETVALRDLQLTHPINHGRYDTCQFVNLMVHSLSYHVVACMM